jgi:hypothetical protein
MWNETERERERERERAKDKIGKKLFPVEFYRKF